MSGSLLKMGCILSYFIIKPQPSCLHFTHSTGCILSYFIIKPQLKWSHIFWISVVSYLISSSNHNQSCGHRFPWELYLILFHHQTTTTATWWTCWAGCILSYFIIKPQPSGRCPWPLRVVSYLISSSNHNRSAYMQTAKHVVSYLISSSNHNPLAAVHAPFIVVSYLISSSNHNHVHVHLEGVYVVSYLISSSNHNRRQRHLPWLCVVSYLISSSNHNLSGSWSLPSGVVSYLISSSNHNRNPGIFGSHELYLILFHHQTTTKRFSLVMI